MSNNNIGYWLKKSENKKKAVSHTALMESKYSEEIKNSISRTIIYGGANRLPDTGLGTLIAPEVKIIEADSVSAILTESRWKTAVLNFASYKHPGGMFLEGSSAQEESLCHESFLYNVLKEFNSSYYAWNNQNKNKSLYRNRALYSPGIIFEREDSSPVLCDVITCAAPNYSAAHKYSFVSAQENLDALSQRIWFVKAVAEENQLTTLILGAFGCGVFGQDPHVVSEMLFSAFDTTNIRNIIYAIPSGPNLAAFKEEFDKYNESKQRIAYIGQ